jgi:tetratricopeptide (TPR) repeat protein
METTGQLTFSDDPLLTGVNEIYLLIESGDFSAASEKADLLLTANPDYPGLSEAFRTSRFWQIRLEEAHKKPEGIDRATFLMDQWKEFSRYAEEKKLIDSSAFKSVQKFIYYTAAEHYKIAFHLNQTERFGNLVSLGICFLMLGEYLHAVETFEYAKSSTKADAKIISLLAESYFQTGDIPKSLLLFREAFALDPSAIDLSLIHAKPVVDLLDLSKKLKPASSDPREWIPVAGHISDLFYVRRQINNQQLDAIKKEIYNLEKNYQSLTIEQKNISQTTPRLITKYLWLYDYYSFQTYNYDNASQIRDRLIEIDKGIFVDYFKNVKR